MTLRTRFIAFVCISLIIFSISTTVWSAPVEKCPISGALSHLTKAQQVPFESSAIAGALSDPTLPPEAHQAAHLFLSNTLPRLLDDNRLVTQLGFGGAHSRVTLDRAMPLIILHHEDIFKFAAGTSHPFDLVNNTNNWKKNKAGQLDPTRIVFSLKVDNGTSQSIPAYSWSSVTLENYPAGSWRIQQIGAPKLARALNVFQAPRTKHFLIWIPDLNRHYLGQICFPKADLSTGEPNLPSIILTVLFNDPLVLRSAGEQFDITSHKFIEHLQELYRDLDLAKRLSRQSSEKKTPVQAK
ncbi:MAG TPA: hypothetical protein VJR03_01470 [Nitrospira sp.]|nr:hypothetical protein [Nitrospira sp.]